MISQSELEYMDLRNDNSAESVEPSEAIFKVKKKEHFSKYSLTCVGSALESDENTGGKCKRAEKIAELQHTKR